MKHNSCMFEEYSNPPPPLCVFAHMSYPQDFWKTKTHLWYNGIPGPHKRCKFSFLNLDGYYKITKEEITTLGKCHKLINVFQGVRWQSSPSNVFGLHVIGKFIYIDMTHLMLEIKLVQAQKNPTLNNHTFQHIILSNDLN